MSKLTDWLNRQSHERLACMAIAAGLYVIISGLQFLGGLTEAPKHKSMTRIEVLFPAYQVGLWMGTRVNGEHDWRADR